MSAFKGCMTAVVSLLCSSALTTRITFCSGSIDSPCFLRKGKQVEQESLKSCNTTHKAHKELEGEVLSAFDYISLCSGLRSLQHSDKRMCISWRVIT